jgi:Arc/MetJ family transcription regulator
MKAVNAADHPPSTPPNSVYQTTEDEVYPLGMATTTTKRTNINLDTELVQAAAAVLGTVQTTETVHAALRDVVERAARQRLAERNFPDLTPETLNELRSPRSAA